MTAHPTAGWTVQQFREVFPSDHHYRFLIHDRASIFSTEVDDELKVLRSEGAAHAGAGPEGERVLRTADRDGAA